jgi:hypothetical protein
VGKSYGERKDQVAGILREQSKKGRDIGPLPSVADPARRASCEHDFQRFCETYFPNVFTLTWSPDHLLVISIIQNAILNGGLSAVAMPRGSGKSSLCLAAAVWALVYGHRHFVVLIGASEDHAKKLLKNLVTDFQTNDLLAADFPEVCYPIRALENISKRCAGQTCDGEPTRITWTANELVLPTIEGSKVSGSRMSVAGITGAIRGLNAKLADGSSIRPDFCLIDDPQTSESAQSPKQVHDRLGIINGDVLGLAGPGEKISAVCPCTVIAKHDVADQLLDRKKNPVWQGVRTKLLKSEPTNAKLWEEYAEVWADSLREFGNIAAATQFYLDHRDELDAGADAAWAARHNEDEASAIQNAMNLKLRDEASFCAEYQNEPLSMEAVTPLILTSDQIAAKAVAGLKRGIVPSYATKLTSFIDVQGSVLFYVVVAIGNDFTAHVVDYGCWPQQAKNYFFLREVNPTLATATKVASTEGQIRAGLEALTKHLLDREWERIDGGTQQIDRLVIDAGWNMDIVKQWIAESGSYRTRLLASKGYGVTADRAPMDSWKEHEGGRKGWNWVWRRVEGLLFYDTNSWKTFTAERLRMFSGESGNLSLFEGTTQAHKLFSDHVTSESVTPTEGNGRMVTVWKLRPNRENHWYDCLIGCLVAASEQGILFVGHQPQIGQVVLKKRRKVVANFG